MADHTEDNDPFEEDIVFDQAGLLGGKMPRSRQQSTVGFLPTFMLFIRTVFLCIAFVGLGLCVSVSGSPLIRLEVGMGVPVDTAFHIFTARSVGMLLGGMLGSLLFDIYNRQFLMFVSLVWVAVSVTVLPFTVPTALWWTFTTTAALGIGLGFLFTGGNVLCLDLWGRQGGASLQSLHFSFAVGAFIAPLVIHPFFVGLHPAEIHNMTEVPVESTTQALEVARYVREAANFGDGGSNDSFDFSSLDIDAIKKLTMPTTSLAPDSNVSVNNSADVTPSSPSRNQSESTPSVNTSPTLSEVTPASGGVQKHKKPSFTNGNDLKSESDSKWKKKPQKESQESTSSDQSNKSKTTTTETVSLTPNTLALTTLPPNKTIGDEIVTEVSTISDPSLTKSESVNQSSSSTTDQADLASEEVTPPVQNQTSDIQDMSTISFSSSSGPPLPSTPSPTSTTTSSTTTTTTTTTSTTTTTTTTTTSPTTTSTTTTTTTTTPPPMTSTPTTEDPGSILFGTQGKSNVASNINSFLSSKETNQNYDSINIHPESVEVADEIEDSLEEGVSIGNSQYDNTSFPEPELLDLKESMMDRVSPDRESSTTDTPDGSAGIHFLKPGTYSNKSDENNQFLDDVAQRFKDYGVTKVHLAYICIGIFIILNALISVVILCHNPREPRSKQEDGNTNEFHRGRMILFVVIFSVFMFMAESLQGAVHHLLASSNTNTGLDVIKESGLDGQALFWGLVCVVRFLCIMLSGCLRLKPGKLLTMAILFSIIGAIFLAIGSFGKGDFLWGGVIFMALGLAPILPTSLLWMAQYMRVTHRMCALMIILASFGNSLTHLALTHVVGRSHLYAYILIFISGSSLFFLFLSMCALYTAQRSKALGVPIGYQLASQHEEEDSIELTPSGSAVFTPSDPRIRENGEAGQSLLID